MPMMLPMKGITLPSTLSGFMMAMKPKAMNRKPRKRSSQVMIVFALAAFLNIVSALTVPASMKSIASPALV